MLKKRPLIFVLSKFKNSIYKPLFLVYNLLLDFKSERVIYMKSAQLDMTAGSPMKMILNFTLPIFIGNIFQQFYNMADAVIVGKFVGTKALAAVGSTGTIMFLIYGFVVGIYRADRPEIWRW